MMWYVQPDGRMIAIMRGRLIEHYQLFRNELSVNLEDAAALCAQAQKTIAEARRTRHLSHLIRRAAVESRRVQ